MDDCTAKPRVLAIDVGGSNVKLRVSDRGEVRKRSSGPDFTPVQLVETVRELTADWSFDVISIGYPGPVSGGRPSREPRNLGAGWADFDFEAALGRPVRLLNDAALQALGSYDGGRMLFLGLGTGLGSAIVVEGCVVATELAHLPYKKGRTFEDYLGKRGLVKRGRKKWRKAVFDVVGRLAHALQAEYVVLGGGNVKKLAELPPGARRGHNSNAFVGGFRLWGAG